MIWEGVGGRIDHCAVPSTISCHKAVQVPWLGLPSVSMWGSLSSAQKSRMSFSPCSRPAASLCSGIWLHPLGEALMEAGTDSRTSQDLGQETGTEMKEQELLSVSGSKVRWRDPSLIARVALWLCRTCAAPGELHRDVPGQVGQQNLNRVGCEQTKPFSKGKTPRGSPGRAVSPCRCHRHHPAHSLVLGTTTNVHSVLSLSQRLHLQKCSCSFTLIPVFLLCRFRRSKVLHPLPCRGECCCFPLSTEGWAGTDSSDPFFWGKED